MSDLAPFWIREMQARIESDWNKMHADQHRVRMREITATLSPDALHELWGSMGLEEPETVEVVTFGEPAAGTLATAQALQGEVLAKHRQAINAMEFARAQAEEARALAES